MEQILQVADEKTDWNQLEKMRTKYKKALKKYNQENENSFFEEVVDHADSEGVLVVLSVLKDAPPVVCDINVGVNPKTAKVLSLQSHQEKVFFLSGQVFMQNTRLSMCRLFSFLFLFPVTYIKFWCQLFKLVVNFFVFKIDHQRK